MNTVSPLFALEASALIGAGRLEAALALCEQGVAAYPDYPTAYLLLAKAYAGKGDTLAANDTLRRGVERLPLAKPLHILQQEIVANPSAFVVAHQIPEEKHQDISPSSNDLDTRNNPFDTSDIAANDVAISEQEALQQRILEEELRGTLDDISFDTPHSSEKNWDKTAHSPVSEQEKFPSLNTAISTEKPQTSAASEPKTVHTELSTRELLNALDDALAGIDSVTEDECLKETETDWNDVITELDALQNRRSDVAGNLYDTSKITEELPSLFEEEFGYSFAGTSVPDTWSPDFLSADDAPKETVITKKSSELGGMIAELDNVITELDESPNASPNLPESELDSEILDTLDSMLSRFQQTSPSENRTEQKISSEATVIPDEFTSLDDILNVLDTMPASTQPEIATGDFETLDDVLIALDDMPEAPQTPKIQYVSNQIPEKTYDDLDDVLTALDDMPEIPQTEMPEAIYEDLDDFLAEADTETEIAGQKTDKAKNRIWDELENISEKLDEASVNVEPDSDTEQWQTLDEFLADESNSLPENKTEEREYHPVHKSEGSIEIPEIEEESGEKDVAQEQTEAIVEIKPKNAHHLRIIDSTDLSGFPVTQWRSKNLRLIPGLEFAPLRFEGQALHLHERMYSVPAPPPFPEFKWNPLEPNTEIYIPSVADGLHGELPEQIEEEQPKLTPLEELARRLQSAKMPRVQEEVAEDRRYAESAGSSPVITETIAKIYEMQGAISEAIGAYQTLADEKPEKRDIFLAKIEALQEKL